MCEIESSKPPVWVGKTLGLEPNPVRTVRPIPKGNRIFLPIVINAGEAQPDTLSDQSSLEAVSEREEDPRSMTLDELLDLL